MRPKTIMRTACFLLLCLTLASSRAGAVEIEVLHWWTSGGEAAALGILKERLKEEGIDWKDMPVAGGVARPGGAGARGHPAGRRADARL